MRRWVFILFLVSLAVGLSPGHALAGHVGCGDTITTDTTLDSDLINCPGDGVVIGAANITLDLGGHVIDGVGVGTAVVNSAGHVGVEVRNGTVQQFDIGTHLLFASGNRVSQLTASNNDEAGIALDGSDNNLLESNTTFNNGAGITLRFSHGNRVRENATSANGSCGIFLFSSTNNLLEKNTAFNNGQFGCGGIFLHVDSDGNRVEKNTASNQHPNGTGILVEASDNNLVAKNTTSNNLEGIFVADAFGTLLEGNVASQNFDDGIDVDNPATTLTRNTANNNGDLGIEAAPGVTDGGGNKASGNGNPAQCLNVACK